MNTDSENNFFLCYSKAYGIKVLELGYGIPPGYWTDSWTVHVDSGEISQGCNYRDSQGQARQVFPESLPAEMKTYLLIRGVNI